MRWEGDKECQGNYSVVGRASGPPSPKGQGTGVLSPATGLQLTVRVVRVRMRGGDKGPGKVSLHVANEVREELGCSSVKFMLISLMWTANVRVRSLVARVSEPG